MSDRQPVEDTPFGAPEAGEVRVYQVDPATGERLLVRTEDPWDAELAAGKSLPGGPGQPWASGGADGRGFEYGNSEGGS